MPIATASLVNATIDEGFSKQPRHTPHPPAHDDLTKPRDEQQPPVTSPPIIPALSSSPDAATHPEEQQHLSPPYPDDDTTHRVEGMRPITGGQCPHVFGWSSSTLTSGPAVSSRHRFATQSGLPPMYPATGSPFLPHGLASVDAAALVPIPDGCFYCGSRFHWYTRCSSFQGQDLFVLSEVDHNIYRMRHSNWLQGAQVIDVLTFVHQATGLHPSDLELVISNTNTVVRHSDPSSRCCEVGLLPGGLLVVVLTPVARLRHYAGIFSFMQQMMTMMPLPDTHNPHALNSRLPPDDVFPHNGKSQFLAPPWDNGSRLAPAHSFTYAPHVGGGAFDDLLYAASSDQNADVELFDYHRHPTVPLPPLPRMPYRLVNPSFLREGPSSQLDVAAAIHPRGHVVSQQHQDVEHADGPVQEDTPNSSSEDINSSVSTVVVIERYQRREERGSGAQEMPLVDQRRLVDGARVPTSPLQQQPHAERGSGDVIDCKPNGRTDGSVESAESDVLGGLHNVSHISEASTSLMRSVPAMSSHPSGSSPSAESMRVVLNESEDVTAEAATYASAVAGHTRTPNRAASTTPAKATSTPNSGDGTSHLSSIPVWADLSVATTHQNTSDSECNRTTISSGGECITQHCSDVSIADPSVILQHRHVRNRSMAAPINATCPQIATEERFLRTVPHDATTVAVRAEAASTRHQRTVHYKFIPSTMNFKSMRTMFFASGVVHKVRLVDPGNSTDKALRDRFCLAFVEYATRFAATKAISMFDKMKIGKFRLSVTQSKAMIAGCYNTDACVDGKWPCTFGLEEEVPSVAANPSSPVRQPRAGSAASAAVTDVEGEKPYKLTPKLQSRASASSGTPLAKAKRGGTMEVNSVSSPVQQDCQQTPDTTAKVVMLTSTLPSTQLTNDVRKILFRNHKNGQETNISAGTEDNAGGRTKADQRRVENDVHSSSDPLPLTSGSRQPFSPFDGVNAQGIHPSRLARLTSPMLLSQKPIETFVTKVLKAFTDMGVTATYYNALRECERLCLSASATVAANVSPPTATYGATTTVVASLVCLLDLLLMKCALHIRFGTPSAFLEAVALVQSDLIPNALQLISAPATVPSSSQNLLRLKYVVSLLLGAASLFQSSPMEPCQNVASLLLSRARDLTLHHRHEASSMNGIVGVPTFGPAAASHGAWLGREGSGLEPLSDLRCETVDIERMGATVDIILKEFFTRTSPLVDGRRAHFWIGKHLFPTVYSDSVRKVMAEENLDEDMNKSYGSSTEHQRGGNASCSFTTQSPLVATRCADELALKILLGEQVLFLDALGC